MSNKAKNKNPHAERRLKIRFYLMSLCLLFMLIFLLTIDIPVCEIIEKIQQKQDIAIMDILLDNVIPMVALLLAIYGLFLSRVSKYEWGGASNPPYKIKSIKNENFEYLTFLTTYIIPLICIDLDNIRYVIVLCILLIVIGAIFIKTDLYYGNPTLALMGYHLYRVELENYDSPDGVILLSKDKLIKGASVKWIRIDQYVWVAEEIK